LPKGAIIVSRDRAVALDAELDRRALLGMGAGLAAAGILATSARAQDSSPSPTKNGLQADGTWQFTDDRGVTVVLDKLPERIVADVNVAAALWDFGVIPVGVFGWNVVSDTEVAGKAGGELDMSQTEVVSAFGTDQIDIEKLAGLAPDLVISLVYLEQYGIWSINPDSVESVEAVAPIVTLSGIIRADEQLNHTVELVQALGVDLESEELVAQREAYEAATDAFVAAVEGNKGVSALFMATSAAMAWIANPDAAGDVWLYRDLGLNVPSVDVPEGEYWLELSVEEVNMFDVDLVFNSERGEILTIEDLQAQPTYGLMSAVKAGQVATWNQDVITSYRGLAEALTHTAEAVAGADSTVGAL
jgi:iron complex transport system substrate-binding protein